MASLPYISIRWVNPTTLWKSSSNDSDFLQLFETLNLEDQDIQEKIWKAFQPTGDNEFLGNDVFKIAEKYKLTNSPDLPFKVLIKK